MSVALTLAPEVRGALSVFPIEAMRSFGVDAFVTDRFGGVSQAPYDTLNLGSHVGDDPGDVQENRRRVAEAAGVAIDQLVIVRQVHGDHVVEARRFDQPVDADAIFTSSVDLAIAVLVADCLPILLVDSDSNDFCVVHAGWRGLEARILDRAVERFSNSARIHAFIGPSISSENYQVGPEVAQHFSHVPGALFADSRDRSRLDIRRVAEVQLRNQGVPDGDIIVSVQCTDGGGLFFSDRAQRPCGRFALVARRALT